MSPHTFLTEDDVHDVVVAAEPSEWSSAVASFVREGLDAGAQCLCAVNGDDRRAVVTILREAGIDVAAEEKRGGLVVAGTAELELTAAGAELASALRRAVDKAVSAGFTAVRLVSCRPPGGPDRVREYEAQLDALCRERPLVALCGYDTARSAPDLIEALRAHRSVRLGDLRARPNPWYEPPEVRLGTASDERRLEFMLDRVERVAALERACSAAQADVSAKDDVLAAVSHEMRGPLANVLGWVRLLNRGEPARGEIARALATIERNTLAQVRLVDDIIDLARIARSEMRLDLQPVDLRDVVRPALESVRPAADGKGVWLAAALDAPVPPVHGDGDRLQQVVGNLLANAVKFTPRGGEVRVALRADHGSTAIVISDTGEGIAPEFLPRVFDRFSQAHTGTTRRHGGLGLGLAIARHIVTLHGGTIRAESDGPGRGSTFTITLPTAAAPTAAGTPALVHVDGVHSAGPHAVPAENIE
jgi:signal transduction histidine kinase